MNTPNFILPACPFCSSIHAVNAPYWRYCRNVSKRDEKSTYSLIGCDHAESMQGIKMLSNPEDWARVEAEWKESTVRWFEQKTAEWTEEHREILRKSLEGKAESIPEEKPTAVQFSKPMSIVPEIQSIEVVDPEPYEAPVLTPPLDEERLEEVRLDEEVPF